MKNKVILSLSLTFAVLLSCGRRADTTDEPSPAVADSAAMHRIEGIWQDELTEAVVFRIKGDSIFYPDSTNLPARFAIFADTLVIYASSEAHYPISHLGDNFFVYESLTGEEMKVVRSNDESDSLLFEHRDYAPILLDQRVRRDTVVYADGERYHLYIDVSPTRRRVFKTTYTDEGMAVENAYFDNIIHIGVYSGRKCLYSHDFQKTDFSDVVTPQFIEGAILSNMEFGHTNAAGSRFLATLCEPDGSTCYVVEITIGFDGKVMAELLQP